MFNLRIIDKAHIAQFSLKIEIIIQRVPPAYHLIGIRLFKPIELHLSWSTVQ